MKPRNHHAHAPILRKGGPHQKSNQALRQQDKRQLAKELHNIKATKGRLDCFWLLPNSFM